MYKVSSQNFEASPPYLILYFMLQSFINILCMKHRWVGQMLLVHPSIMWHIMSIHTTETPLSFISLWHAIMLLPPSLPADHKNQPPSHKTWLHCGKTLFIICLSPNFLPLNQLTCGRTKNFCQKHCIGTQCTSK